MPGCTQIMQLPFEIILDIFSFLDYATLQELCQVNKLCYSLLCQDDSLLASKFLHFISKYEMFILDPEEFRKNIKISWGRLKHIENTFKKFLGDWIIQLDPFGGLVKIVLKDMAFTGYLITATNFDVAYKTSLFHLNLLDTKPNNNITISKCNILEECSHCCCIASSDETSKISLKCELAIAHDKHRICTHLKGLFSSYHLKTYSETLLKQLNASITLSRFGNMNKSVGNIYMGYYGLHGVEFQHSEEKDGHLILSKISGDPNVPCGKTTVDVDLSKHVNLSLAINHSKNRVGWINECIGNHAKTQTINGSQLNDGFKLVYDLMPRRVKELMALKEFQVEGVYKGVMTLRMPPSDYYYNDVIFIIVDKSLFINIWDLQGEGYIPSVICYTPIPQVCQIQSKQSPN